MNTLLRISTAVMALLIVNTAAEARQRHHHRHYHHTKAIRSAAITPYIRCDDRYPNCAAQPQGHTTQERTAYGSDLAERIVSHPAGCPGRAFCGCGVSVKVFGHPVRDLFLASNWRKFPSAYPSAGMVAWRNHHVMYIESMDANGNAVVYDPNSGGHQTRVHTRSLAGYHIVNPNGSRIAMR